jgi:hypothetical protein
MPQSQQNTPWSAFWIFYLLAALWMWLTVPSYAQTQPSPNLTYSTTPNLLNPTVNAWTGTVQGQNAGYSGGTTPAFNPSTNTIIFGYTMATAAQTIAINQALSGTGIQVGGYNYSWNINNDPVTGQYGTLTGRVILRDAGGNALQTYNYNYPQQSGGFINFSGTQWFPQDYTLANLSNLELSFTGKDARFWAGYYGPQVRTPSLSLRYTVDPCATNPAYSPSCPGYNTVSISNNLLPGTTGTQAYAINQALALAGAGATIHGFNYGYTYNVSARQCAIFDLLGFCLTGWNYSDAGVSTVITDSNSATLFSESNTHNGNNNGTTGSYSKQFRFSSSLPMSTLGGFAMSPWTLGNASITNMYSEAVYTADPCTANPLHSPSCAGYAAAYLTQQCSANPLYDASCPGYAAAYLTQQCSANPLYDASCPGYQTAYFTQQCSMNPLYNATCPGYQTAYFNQQCTANPLYDRSCPGYNTAYATQQNTQTSSATTASSSTTTSSVSLTGTVSTTEPTLTIATDGTVTTGVAVVPNSEVNAVVTKKVETTASPTGSLTVQIQTKPATDSEQQKKGREATAAERELAAKEEKKREEEASDRRKQLAERQRRAAQEGAVARGREAIREADSAKTLDEQMANQSFVVATMSFVPGFEAYGQVRLPDAQFYIPREIYRGQQNVDNQRLLRGLTGASDQRHTDMVNSQYER